MNMQSQPISAERAAALLAALVPAVARVETYPQWSDGTGVEVRRQRVTLYDAAGDILGATREEHREVLRVLLRVEGGDWDRPQTFTVDGAALSPTFPVVSSLPVALWESPAAEDPYRVAQLDVQRHELEDAVVPPLAVSVAAGYVEPVVWDDPAPTRQVQEDVVALLGLPEPTPPVRPVVDVPVQGGAL